MSTAQNLLGSSEPLDEFELITPGVRLLRGPTAMEQLRASWQRLEADPDTEPFKLFNWTRTWLDHLGGRSIPWLLVSGDPVDGILPLYWVRNRGLSMLRLIGDGVSDYLGPICSSVDAARRLGAALDVLLRRVDVAVLRGVNPVDPSTAALLETVRRPSLSRLYERCPAIDTSGGWHAYLDTREGSWSRRLKRTRRRMEKRGSVTVAVEAPSERLFDEVCEVERASWKWEGGFARSRDPSLRAFLREVIISERVPLEMWVCRLDGAMVAFTLCFKLEHRLEYYWPTYRQDISGSGLYLLADMVKSCCDRRLQEFDFMQGDESYKLDWMTHEHRCDEVVMRGSFLKGGLYCLGVKLRWALARSELLKDWRRRVLVARHRMRGS